MDNGVWSERRVMSASAILLLAVSTCATATPPNFADDVGPILEVWCVDCHRGSRGKNGVALQDHAATMKGGSAGAIVVPGDPGSSILYLVASHDRDPVMPPDGDRLSDEELATIRAWIEGGCRRDADDEGAGPKVSAMKPLPRRAVGAAVMPLGSANPQPFWHHDRSDAVIAMDASPTSPLLAVGGHRQTTLYAIETGEALACLPFPEGSVHDLRFSADGAVLVVGGGRDGASGLVSIFDIATGTRLATIGGEPDAVLAADLSPDGSMVALGGPDGVVRVVDLATGEALHRLTPHTDWITAVRFSPDGSMLATADRAGGGFVWEAWTGREFHRLPGLGSAATEIAWRADSNLVAIATDAGPVAVFGMERGDRIANQSLHGGTLAVRFLPDGRLLTAGRDGRGQVGDVGGGEVAGWPSIGDLATSVTASADGSIVAIGGLDGIVRVHRIGESDAIFGLRADPPLIESAALSVAEATLAELVASRAEVDTVVGTTNDALSVAKDAAHVAAAEATAAETAETAALTALDTARSLAASLESMIAEPRRRLQEAEDRAAALSTQLQALESEADRRRTEMRAAISAVSRLEADAVMQGRGDETDDEIAAARRLADGATALAQRAVTAAADARTSLDATSIETETWAAAIDARRPEIDAAADAVRVASEAAATATQARISTAEALAARGRDLELADAAARGAREASEGHRQRIAEAEAKVAAARQALAERRSAVAEAGGRVRDSDA